MSLPESISALGQLEVVRVLLQQNPAAVDNNLDQISVSV